MIYLKLCVHRRSFLLLVCSGLILTDIVSRAADAITDAPTDNAAPELKMEAAPLPTPAVPSNDASANTMSAGSDATQPITTDAASQPPALPPGEPGDNPPAVVEKTNGTDGTHATDGTKHETKPASSNAMVNLVNLLVQQGVIKKENGDKLIEQATAEAAQASVAPAPTTLSDNSDVNVDYVPKPVEDKIRSDVKQDVMDQAREENWAAPRQLPQWLQHISFFGDFRFRYEGDYFPSGNVPSTGNPFINFNSINTGTPVNFGISPGPLVPVYNVDQDRDRLRIRARMGLNADLDGFTAGFRIASGTDDSPVTENQSLGAATGQGGNFSKYSVWIDRAFLAREWGGAPVDGYDVNLEIGRFDNPFFHTSMLFADDLGFDGAAVQAKYQVVDGFTPFFNGGAFPVFNTDLNFGTNSTVDGSGYSSEDKWLFAGQLGATWKINDDFSLKVAGAFYDYENIQGEVSSDIDLSNGSPSPLTVSGFNGNTDDSRPAFAQFGNTYIPLRNYVNSGVATTSPAFFDQYYGLATAFREAVVTGQLDFSRFDPFHLSLTGELVKNTAFDRDAILNNGPTFGGPTASGPINNGGSDGFYGGDMGWLIRANAGKVALEKLWDWNLNAGYRYVQTDATVDGFADSDFGGYINGTNLKGYTVGGNLAFSKWVWAGVRFMSANTVAGPDLTVDTLQLDINAKF